MNGRLSPIDVVIADTGNPLIYSMDESFLLLNKENQMLLQAMFLSSRRTTSYVRHEIYFIIFTDEMKYLSVPYRRRVLLSGHLSADLNSIYARSFLVWECFSRGTITIKFFELAGLEVFSNHSELKVFPSCPYRLKITDRWSVRIWNSLEGVPPFGFYHGSPFHADHLVHPS